MTEQNKIDTQLRVDNLVAWHEIEALKKGTDNQRQRWAHNVLPEDELTAIVREHVFVPELRELRRWAGNELRAMDAEVRKECRRRATPLEHTLEHEVAEIADVAAHEWDCLTAINDAVKRMSDHPWLQRGGKVELETVTHWSTCTLCKAEAWRHVAKVSVHWAGRVLVREYILERKPRAPA